MNHRIFLTAGLVLATVLLVSGRVDGMAPWKPKKAKKQKPGKWFQVLSSFYGGTPADDNGLGAGGVNLFRFPYRRRVNDTFGTRTIYPVAMPTKDIPYYKYAILEITYGKNRIFGQVVDECGSGDCWDNEAIAKKQKRKLVDIHKTAWTTIGANDGLQKMKARIVSRGSKRDPQMAPVFTSDGARGYVPNHWK